MCALTLAWSAMAYVNPLGKECWTYYLLHIANEKINNSSNRSLGNYDRQTDQQNNIETEQVIGNITSDCMLTCLIYHGNNMCCTNIVQIYTFLCQHSEEVKSINLWDVIVRSNRNFVNNEKIGDWKFTLSWSWVLIQLFKVWKFSINFSYFGWQHHNSEYIFIWIHLKNTSEIIYKGYLKKQGCKKSIWSISFNDHILFA